MITSPHNPTIRLAIQLRDARPRKKHGLTLIDGVRELQYALRGRVGLHTVLTTDAGLQRLRDQDWFAAIAADRIQTVSDDLMRRIQFGDRDESLLALVSIPERPLRELKLTGTPLVLVLDQIEKPGNLGAMLRTADAAGVSAVVLTDPVCEPFNPNAIRASMGAIFCLPMAVAGVGEFLAWCGEKGLSVWTARVDGQKTYDACDFTRATAIVMGSEARGLSLAWPVDTPSLRLPMHGIVDSLNVSVAAGILMFEGVRQRRGHHN
jgi:TrmH family RNA methyltransferase